MVGKVGALIAVALALVWLAHRVRVSYVAEHQRDAVTAELKAEREQNAANIGAIAQDIQENERERGFLATRLDAIDKRMGGLLVNVPKPEALIQTRELPDAPCPHVGLSNAFVGVYNAASTEAGSPEAQAR